MKAQQYITTASTSTLFVERSNFLEKYKQQYENLHKSILTKKKKENKKKHLPSLYNNKEAFLQSLKVLITSCRTFEAFIAFNKNNKSIGKTLQKL